MAEADKFVVFELVMVLGSLFYFLFFFTWNSVRELNKGDEIAWYADGEYTVRNEFNSSIAYGFGSFELLFNFRSLCLNIKLFLDLEFIFIPSSQTVDSIIFFSEKVASTFSFRIAL